MGRACLLLPVLRNERDPDTVELTDTDITRVLRQPVSMAAILDDLCRLLEIEPPTIMRLTIGT
jgi:hypothetical protein